MHHTYKDEHFVTVAIIRWCSVACAQCFVMATLQVLCFFAAACFMSTTAANPPPQTNPPTTTPDVRDFVQLQEVNNFTYRHGRAYSGDAYLDEAYDACLTSKNTLSCFKYKALRYLHKVASPTSEGNGLKYLSEDGFNVLGSTIRLVSLPEKTAASSREFVREHFPDTEANESDSELDRLYKFALREAERFIRGHAVTVRIPVGDSQSRGIQDPALPTARLIDEDHPENEVEEDVNTESRGKKKKLAYLLPLVLFFKLKMLLVPILLAVLFIKKILILGAVLLPSLAGMVKLCKPHHSHSYGWSSSGDTSGEFSTGYGHVAPYHGDYHHSRRSARWDNQGLAYRGYQQRTGSTNGDGTVTGV